MRKATMSSLVVFLLALGCRGEDNAPALEENKALLHRAHSEIWSKGDMAAADEIYAPEYVGHWTGRPDTNGLDEFKAFVAEARERFPDWNETIEQIVAEGDLVVTRFTSRGTFAGEPGVPPDGRQITMQEIAIHRIVDGKIVEQWTVADILGMRQQLGTLEASAEDSDGEK